MARIRSIKPDFWTDEKVVELSAFARLLFIGLWNFADDDGRMVYSPKKIKMQIFPADTLDISELFGEIRGESLINIYVIDGIEYLQVVGFAKHQKIDKRTASKLPENNTPPPNPPEFPRIPTTDMEGKGMEGIVIMSGKPDSSTPKNPKTKPNGSECKSVLEYLNEKAGSNFKAVPANINLIQARFNEGATLEEMKLVIDSKIIEWKADEKMAKYLRPDTLFNASKYASYAGQVSKSGATSMDTFMRRVGAIPA